MNLSRVQTYGKSTLERGPILYWMNRECRVGDNWSLLFAQEVVKQNGEEVVVVYNLDPKFLGGGLRQLHFKIEGLREVEKELAALHIPFSVLVEHNTVHSLCGFIKTKNIGGVITDFSPLRIQRNWIQQVEQNTNVAMYVVDSHNIVPCWTASQKIEFGAYTLRPKLKKLLPEYLEEFPAVESQSTKEFSPIVWEKILQQCETNTDVAPVTWIQGGSTKAKHALQTFINTRLERYDQRNDPNAMAISDLSPFFHYGHLAPQRVALEIEKQDHISPKIRESFLEELIVRRELADNFCYYNPHYDSFDGFPTWAKKTLLEHINDARPYLYSKQELEQAKTHDPLWNAAQLEMVKHGKMHGYMRMYWAKKLLEWTTSPDEALQIGIYLNDKYELDGRDPNGYVGLAWSIGGVHDRAWFEREVFGKIRYMNANGCKRKFDTEAYIAYVEKL